MNNGPKVSLFAGIVSSKYFMNQAIHLRKKLFKIQNVLNSLLKEMLVVFFQLYMHPSDPKACDEYGIIYYVTLIASFHFSGVRLEIQYYTLN